MEQYDVTAVALRMVSPEMARALLTAATMGSGPLSAAQIEKVVCWAEELLGGAAVVYAITDEGRCVIDLRGDEIRVREATPDEKRDILRAAGQKAD